VVTVGALISMAAHLEGHGVSVLDFTGFAQKFGPVLSFLRLGPTPDALSQVRIDTGAADALIGCDIVVSTAPTGDIVLNRDASLEVPERLKALEGAVGAPVGALDAGRLSERFFGDTVFANMVMLGFAWQSGLVPVSLAALEQAIALNGVAPEANRRALAFGRLAAANPALLAEPAPPELSLAGLIERRAQILSEYQDPGYAQRYRQVLAPVLALGDEGLSRAAAQSLFKLMAIKDEYEVARLHRDPAFARRITEGFGPGVRVSYHLAPPLWPGALDHRGRPRKRRFPGWLMRPALAALVRLKGLRGTWADPFGYHPERRRERALLAWFEAILARAPAEAPANLPRWRRILAAPMDIRGYGPVKDAAAAEVRARVETLLRG